MKVSLESFNTLVLLIPETLEELRIIEHIQKATFGWDVENSPSFYPPDDSEDRYRRSNGIALRLKESA